MAALMANFRTIYPNLMPALPNLRFIEQYNPSDTSATATSQPFAFVTDRVEKSELSIDVNDVMAQGVGAAGWDALADLRDQIAPGEKIGWFVVYNGDEERSGEAENEVENDGAGSEAHESSKKHKNSFKRLFSKG